MVVDSTASTVPLSRTARTKSWRETVAVVCRRPDCPDSEFPGSRPRMSAAPVATLTQHDGGGYPQARVALGGHRSLRLSDGRCRGIGWRLSGLDTAAGERRGHSTGTVPGDSHSCSCPRGLSRLSVPALNTPPEAGAFRLSGRRGSCSGRRRGSGRATSRHLPGACPYGRRTTRSGRGRVGRH